MTQFEAFTNWQATHAFLLCYFSEVLITTWCQFSANFLQIEIIFNDGEIDSYLLFNELSRIRIGGSVLDISSIEDSNSTSIKISWRWR